MKMYFNEDIDISKIKTWKDVQNLRRNSENDYKELRDTFGYDGEKKNDHISKLISQYNEKVRLRREFYDGESVDKGLILGTIAPQKVDQLDSEIENGSKKDHEARIAYANSKKHAKELARFKKEAKKEEKAKAKAKKADEEAEKKANAKALKDAGEKARADMDSLVKGKNNVYKDSSKGNNNNTSSTSTSTGKYNNPEPVKTPPNKQDIDDNKTNNVPSEKNTVYKDSANKTNSSNASSNGDSSSKNNIVVEVKDLANKTSEAATAAKSDIGKAKQLVNQAEGNANKIVENVKNVKDKTFLERLKTSLEAKIKKCDQSLSELRFDKGIVTNVLNAIKLVFIKIKQILMKIVKAIVSTLASIHNKFR